MLVLGLDKFVEDLTEISGRAAKEFSLEKVCMVYSFKLIFVLPLQIQPGFSMVDTFFPKFAFLASMRLGGKVFFENTKLVILSPIQCCQYGLGIPVTMVVGLRGVNHTESGQDHFWPYKIQCLFLGNFCG